MEDAGKFDGIRELVEERIPFNRLLGLHLDSADGGHASMRFDFKPDLVGNFHMQILHGGVIAAVLDVIGAAAVMGTFSEDSPLLGIGTVDMRVDYLRPGGGKSFTATGEVMRGGRILCSTRMELHNEEGVLIAIGTAMYRVSRKEVSGPVNV